MRKLFALLSLLVLASMVLAACGGAAPTAARSSGCDCRLLLRPAAHCRDRSARCHWSEIR